MERSRCFVLALCASFGALACGRNEPKVFRHLERRLDLHSVLESERYRRADEPARSSTRTAPTPSLSPRALDAERSLAPRPTPEPGSGAEIELEIVDVAGQPLAGAELRFAVEDERSGIVDDPSVPSGKRAALRPSLPPRAYDVERALAHRPTVAAGAGGKVPLAWPGGRGLLVEARHGELWGFRWFPRDWRETEGSTSSEPPRLELVPDWALRVRVEDSARRLVHGLPVHVRGQGWSQNLGSRAEEEIVFEHVGFQAHGAPGLFEVLVDALVDPPATLTLETRRAAAGPVTLRLPPMGAVEVLVLAPDGRPARNEFVELRFASESHPGPAQRFDTSDPVRTAPTIDGIARFEDVALGTALEAVLARHPDAGLVFDGPTVAGAAVRISLATPPAEPRVRAQAVPEPSAPLTATLAGSLLFDEGIPPKSLKVTIGVDGPEGPREWEAYPSADGAFALDELPSGPARLTVWWGSAWGLKYIVPPLFETQLTLEPDAGAGQRLGAIDLRGKLHRHELVLTGLAPDREFHGRGFYVPAGRPSPQHGLLRFFDPEIAFVAPWPRVDLDLFVPGYRSVALRAFGGRAEVALEPGLPVRLRLVTTGALPAPPRYLKAVLVPAGEARVGIDWEGPAFGPTRELVTLAWGPGRMKVDWIAAEHAPDGSRGGGVVREASEPQYVVLVDTSAEQVFELTLAAEDLARFFPNAEGE